MQRISTSTAVEDLHGAGKSGFRDGNQAEGVLPTNFNADWCNNLQEELANFIESQGIVLDSNDRTQLGQAVRRAIEGGDYKPSVRVASTAAINLAAPGANIDGVAMVAGDRFLEKDHGTPELRGIYIWNGAAVAATRAEDFNDNDEVTSGLLIPVEEGTVNADSLWMLTTNAPVIVGTTSLTFEQKATLFASSAEAQALTILSKAISPGTLAAAFQGSNQSLGQNGYQMLPGGIIIQWGFGPTTTASGANVTLPITFPNNFWSVVVADNATATGGVQPKGCSVTDNSSFAVWAQSSTTLQCSWIAIGN